jgi:hypothetical protein
MTRPLLALSAIALLGVSAGACGGVGKSTGSTSKTASDADKNRFTPAEIRYFQTSGQKAGEADTRAVTAAVKRYYAAANADDGARACRLLYPGVARAAPEDYGQSIGPRHLHGTNCATVLSLMFKYRGGRPATDLTAIEVTSVRLDKGGAAVALLRAPKMSLGEIELQREGGSWKVLQPIGNALT